MAPTLEEVSGIVYRLPVATTNAITFGPARDRRYLAVQPAGPKPIRVRPELNDPVTEMVHHATPYAWYRDLGVIRILHWPRTIAYRLGNVYGHDGHVCWGMGPGVQPATLREADARFWGSMFNSHLLPHWEEHQRGLGCPDRQHTCEQLRVEGRYHERVHTCPEGAPCTLPTHQAHHRCGNKRHGHGRCRIRHDHSGPKGNKCPCCRRKPTCQCAPECRCCYGGWTNGRPIEDYNRFVLKGCNCCPCRQGTCQCPPTACPCCRGICACATRICTHQMGALTLAWHQDYRPDWFGYDVKLPENGIDHGPATALAAWKDTANREHWSTAIQRDDGRWVLANGRMIRRENH